MPYYPILVNIEGETVVVVGGGSVAQRKVETLLEYGAKVNLVSRELTPPLRRYVEEGSIGFLGREFKGSELDGAFLVIAATDDPLLNSKISKMANKKGLLINAVDQPSDCNFIVPSIIKRGDLIISVSSSGKSPALTKKIRKRLDEQFGNEYESFLILMGKLRKEALSQSQSSEENRKLFHRLVDSPILQAIGREDWNEAASILSEILETRVSPADVINYIKAE